MHRILAGVLLSLLSWVLIEGTCTKKAQSGAKGPDPEVCSIPPGLTQDDRKKVRRFRSHLRRKKQKGHFNGTFLLAKKGRILTHGSMGYRDRREQDRLRLSDPFQLASITKPLTATLILELWEADCLSLSDTLSEYFKNWPYSGITVKMLLTHRSGLPNYMYFMEDRKDGRSYNNEDVLEVLKKDTPDVYYIPDYRYNYCNTNYCLLALIAERVTDTNFRTAIKEKVYEKANMGLAKKSLSLTPEKAVVQGHNKWGTPIGHYPNRVVGDKGLYATTLDLFRFDQALRNGKLLADSTLKKAYTPQHDDLYEEDNYGLGWRLNLEDPDDRVVWHNGWWKGFRTYFIRLLDRRITIIVLTNTTKGPFLSKQKLIGLLEPGPRNSS